MGSQGPQSFRKMGPSSIFCGKAANPHARIIPVNCYEILMLTSEEIVFKMYTYLVPFPVFFNVNHNDAVWKWT